VSAGDANRARRARLVERAAAERDELSDRLAPWRGPLAAVDQGLSILHALKRSAPLIGAGLGAAMAAVAFVRPANISDWVRRGQALWRALASGTRSAARPPETKVEPSAGGIPT